MDFKPQYLLSQVTTFRIGGPADFYVSVESVDELKQALSFAKEKSLPVLIVGSGSNMLVSDRGFRGLVIGIAIKGVEFKELGDLVEVKVWAGEVWDDIVAFCVLREIWGIENLSNIPGLTGSFPVQNVGAYGQEAAQVVKNIEALDLEELEVRHFDNQECGFDYRQSNFNTVWKNKFIILNVTLRLSTRPNPNLSYMDVKKYFEKAKVAQPSLQEIRQAIITIRKNKFPDLDQQGSAGSFFKNLILTPQQYLDLERNIQKNFPDAVLKLAEIKKRFQQIKNIKIPTAFLVEICQLNGQFIGQARLWENQALVIVNTGKAKGSDVAKLFKLVRQTVFQKTGMEITNEPEFVGFSEKELSEYYSLT